MLILSPFFLAAQGNWKLGITVEPDLCYRTISYNTDNNIFEKSDYAKFGFAAGITSTYLFTQKFELDFGAIYSYQNILRSSLDKGETAGTDYFEQSMKSDYLLIPLRANLLLGDDGFGFVGNLGFSTGIEIREQNFITIYNVDGTVSSRHTEKSNAYPEVNFNLELGAGIRYSKNDFELRLIPMGRYAVIGKYQTQSNNLHPLTVGLSCALFYSL